ncbi:MAG: hypothetical protein KDD41_04705 [Flavobacteriales bacterium]|nr:hypothetical protein [Flavobacteriales bacterium]
METIRFQIGQCRINVNIGKTKDFYKSQPKISENCTCKDCSYFENIVTKKNIRLMKILSQMGVDLTRQPNINLNGVCSTGETEKFQRSYMGYYKVFGRLGKTQKSTQTINKEGQLESVDFYEPEDDSYIQYKVRQETNDQLTVDFYLECEKKKN